MLDESTLERIRYEFATTPEPGATQPVADGLLWLRMPLPMALAHINLWLHEDSGGWSIIDTGIHDETTRDLWVEVLEGAGRSRDPDPHAPRSLRQRRLAL